MATKAIKFSDGTNTILPVSSSKLIQGESGKSVAVELDRLLDEVYVNSEIFEANPLIFSQLNKKFIIDGEIDIVSGAANKTFTFTNKDDVSESHTYKCLTIGKGSILHFYRGASLYSSETGVYIELNSTEVESPLQKIFGNNVSIIGVFKNANLPVEWFGAIGDGITNDAEAINRTLSNAWTTEVLLSAPTYYVNDSIVISERNQALVPTYYKLLSENVQGVEYLMGIDSTGGFFRGFNFRAKGFIKGGPSIPAITADPNNVKRMNFTGGVICVNGEYFYINIEGGIITDDTSSSAGVYCRQFKYGNLFVNNISHAELGVVNGNTPSSLIGDGFYGCDVVDSNIQINVIMGFARGFVFTDEKLGSGGAASAWGNHIHIKLIDANHGIYLRYARSGSFCSANTLDYSGCGSDKYGVNYVGKGFTDDSTFLSLLGCAGKHVIFANVFNIEYLQGMYFMLFNIVNAGQNIIDVKSCTLSDIRCPIADASANRQRTATSLARYVLGDRTNMSNVIWGKTWNTISLTGGVPIKFGMINIINSHDVVIKAPDKYPFPAWIFSAWNVSRIVVESTHQHNIYALANLANVNWELDNRYMMAKSFRIESPNYTSAHSSTDRTAYPIFKVYSRDLTNCKIMNNDDWTAAKSNSNSLGFYINETALIHNANGTYTNSTTLYPLFVCDSALQNITSKWALREGTDIFVDEADFYIANKLSNDTLSTKLTNYVPAERKINGVALNDDITLPMYEANLQWGGDTGKDHINNTSPIDAALLGDLGANRLCGANPAGIKIYLTNTGEEPAEIDDNLIYEIYRTAFNSGAYPARMVSHLNPNDNSPCTTTSPTNASKAGTTSVTPTGQWSNMLKIVLDADNLSINANKTYFSVNKFIAKVSYNENAKGSKIYVVGETYGGVKRVLSNDIYLDFGLTTEGWIAINLNNEVLFGRTNTLTGNYRYLKVIIVSNDLRAGTSGTAPQVKLSKLYAFGSTIYQSSAYASKSLPAKTGYPYQTDDNGNLTFPVDITSTGNISCVKLNETSDERLKENLHKLTSNDDMPDLYEFDFKESGEHSYGVIAQQIEDEYPSMVYTPEDEIDIDENGNEYVKKIGYKSVNYSALHSMMIAKLCNKIDALEKEIAELKNK